MDNINRDSIADAQMIINGLIENENEKKIICADLAKYWKYAEFNYPEKAYITLSKNYIRMNVGMIEVFVIFSEIILFNTDMNLMGQHSPSHYKSEKDALPIELTHSEYCKNNLKYADAIFSIINKLAKTRKHPSASKSHSQGLVNYLYSEFTPSSLIEEPDEVELDIKEGTRKTVSVIIRDRNLKARKECIEHYKSYLCQICGFDFEKRYGSIGINFIHVHHVKPISLSSGEYIVNPKEDLIPVCPNCHAMLHMRKPEPYSIEEIKKMLQENIER